MANDMTSGLLGDFIAAAMEPEGQDEPLQRLLLARSTGPDTDRKSEKKIVEKLQRYLRQAKNFDQRWRKKAQESWEFYDNDQWTEVDKAALEERRQAPVTINRVTPTIDLVLGLQVTQPLDWIAKPVGLEDDSLADAATAALKHIAGQNNAFDVLMEAYKDALVYGVGWMYTGKHIRDADPLAEAVQITRADPREVRFDPRTLNKDLSDCRYVIWSRKVEVESLGRAYPRLKKRLGLVDRVQDESDDSTYIRYEGIVSDTIPPPSTWDLFDWNEAGKEDVDPESECVYVHEVWERISRKAVVMVHRNGYTHEVDPMDAEVLGMLESPDVLYMYETDIPDFRFYILTGDILLDWGPSPYKHRRFPFVPVWHKRDRWGCPVGMIEMLKDPQREINHRRSRLLWELISNVVLVSPTAMQMSDVESIEEAEMKASRPDAVWVGEEKGVQYLNKPSTAAAQFQLMQDSKAEIQSVSGINDDLMGMDSSSRSGKAKQITMIQGATIQRPKEANLHTSHRMLGEIVLSLIQQYHTSEWQARITDDAGADTFVPLNTPDVDENGQFRVLNDITQARFDLAVQDAPWTPTQRDRAAEILTTMLETEQDPLMRHALQQAILIVGEIPHKAKVLAILNKQQAASQQMMAQQAEQTKLDVPPPPSLSGGLGMQIPAEQAPDQLSPEMLQGLTDPEAVYGGGA